MSNTMENLSAIMQKKWSRINLRVFDIHVPQRYQELSKHFED